MDALMACPVLQIRLPDASDIDGLKRLALHFDAATCFKARLQGLCWIKKLQVGLTCCRGTHDIKDSTHTARYYPLEDSVLQ